MVNMKSCPYCFGEGEYWNEKLKTTIICTNEEELNLSDDEDELLEEFESLDLDLIEDYEIDENE